MKTSKTGPHNTHSSTQVGCYPDMCDASTEAKGLAQHGKEFLVRLPQFQKYDRWYSSTGGEENSVQRPLCVNPK